MGVELIPAIDLRNGQVVRLRRGNYNEQTTYEVDPVDIAKKFQDAGCKWLHVVDLDGAKEGRPVNLAIIEKIVRSTRLRVEVGGGIRTEESMEYVLAIGAHRIILGTRALADMQWFQTIAVDARFRDRLVLGLDAKDGIVRTHGWTQNAAERAAQSESASTRSGNTGGEVDIAASGNAGGFSASGGAKAIDIARDVDNLPLSALIYTDIARDGMLQGPNVQATAKLLKVCKNVPIVHSGGITTLADITALKSLPIQGIIVGRAIYEGTLNVEQAVKELAA